MQLRLLKVWDKGGGGDNIKQCLKIIKGIEILNSDLFCLILFTLLFKEARKIVIQDFSYCLCFFYTIFHKIQRPLSMVFVYDLLVWCSVLKMFARFIFRMEKGVASKKR